MAHFAIVKDRDDMRTCPYNSSHRVRQCRFANHLVKCKRSNQMPGMETCPFNATHVYHKDEKQHHLASCPDRFQVEKLHVSMASANLANTEVPTYQAPPTDWDENWDDEVRNDASMGYNPKDNMNKLQFVSSATFAGLKPSDKRKRRQELTDPRRGMEQAVAQPVMEEAAPVLNELRAPRANPLVMQSGAEPPKLGIGRGRGAAGVSIANHRIAANIFGDPTVNIKEEKAVTIGIGRGRPVAKDNQVVPKQEPSGAR